MKDAKLWKCKHDEPLLFQQRIFPPLLLLLFFILSYLFVRQLHVCYWTNDTRCPRTNENTRCPPPILMLFNPPVYTIIGFLRLTEELLFDDYYYLWNERQNTAKDAWASPWKMLSDAILFMQKQRKTMKDARQTSDERCRERECRCLWRWAQTRPHRPICYEAHPQNAENDARWCDARYAKRARVQKSLMSVPARRAEQNDNEIKINKRW